MLYEVEILEDEKTEARKLQRKIYNLARKNNIPLAMDGPWIVYLKSLPENLNLPNLRVRRVKESEVPELILRRITYRYSQTA